MKVRLLLKAKEKRRERESGEVPESQSRKMRRMHLINGQKRINGLL